MNIIVFVIKFVCVWMCVAFTLWAALFAANNALLLPPVAFSFLNSCCFLINSAFRSTNYNINNNRKKFRCSKLAGYESTVNITSEMPLWATVGPIWPFFIPIHLSITSAQYVTEQILALIEHLRVKSCYRPQTKLRKGNIFTSVCQEFCPRGGAQVLRRSSKFLNYRKKNYKPNKQG